MLGIVTLSISSGNRKMLESKTIKNSEDKEDKDNRMAFFFFSLSSGSFDFRITCIYLSCLLRRSCTQIFIVVHFRYHKFQQYYIGSAFGEKNTFKARLYGKKTGKNVLFK